uniref:Uncharacterized protein n=1 Tax=Anguilla anguilla TaxID=7936 RepID=A0A0E9RY34_ANGAN
MKSPEIQSSAWDTSDTACWEMKAFSRLLQPDYRK